MAAVVVAMLLLCCDIISKRSIGHARYYSCRKILQAQYFMHQMLFIACLLKPQVSGYLGSDVY